MNREEWLKARKKYLGGTDLAAICGLSPYRTALDVYFDKTSDEISNDINAAMRWGNLLEDVVARVYAEDSGYSIAVEPNTLYHSEHSFLGANIDRWSDGKKHVLECKTAGFHRSKEWGDVGTDQIPEAYLIQVAYYAAICDVPKVDIAVLIGGQDFRIYTYTRDPELEDKLIKIACNFWHNHIEKMIPPKCMNTKDTFNLFPQSNHHEIVAEDDIAEKIQQLKNARSEEAKIHTTIERLKVDIQEFMQDYDILINQSGKVIATWKNIAARSIFDCKKLKEDSVDTYLKYLGHTKPTRIFLVK